MTTIGVHVCEGCGTTYETIGDYLNCRDFHSSPLPSSEEPSDKTVTGFMQSGTVSRSEYPELYSAIASWDLLTADEIEQLNHTSPDFWDDSHPARIAATLTALTAQRDGARDANQALIEVNRELQRNLEAEVRLNGRLREVVEAAADCFIDDPVYDRPDADDYANLRAALDRLGES